MSKTEVFYQNLVSWNFFGYSLRRRPMVLGVLLKGSFSTQTGMNGLLSSKIFYRPTNSLTKMCVKIHDRLQDLEVRDSTPCKSTCISFSSTDTTLHHDVSRIEEAIWPLTNEESALDASSDIVLYCCINTIKSSLQSQEILVHSYVLS